MQAAEEGDHGAAHHDVMEVSHDEVGVGQVDVDRQRAQEDAGQSADREQQQERDGIQHRRFKRILTRDTSWQAS